MGKRSSLPLLLAQASRRLLAELRAKDRVKRETAKAKNDLESFIIATRDKVCRRSCLTAHPPAALSAPASNALCVSWLVTRIIPFEGTAFVGSLP